jgi:hypothetical protein
MRSDFNDIFASSRQRHLNGAKLLEELYKVLQEPEINAVVKSLAEQNVTIDLNETLFLQKGKIFITEEKLGDDRLDYVSVCIEPGSRTKSMYNEQIAISGLTPELFREIILKRAAQSPSSAAENSEESPTTVAALSQLIQLPAHNQDFSEAFSRLGFRRQIEHLSSTGNFEIGNPAYFKLTDNPTTRSSMDYFIDLINRAASELGPIFYVKSPDSIKCSKVIKVEVLADGAGYCFKVPRACGSNTFQFIESASLHLWAQTREFSTLLVEAEITGLKYRQRPIELRVLLNRSHEIVGHYVKTVPSRPAPVKGGIDTATVLTRSLALTYWNYPKAREITRDGLGRLAKAFQFLRENQIEYMGKQDKHSLASVDLIPVLDKESERINWFLLESEVPSPSAYRAIGVTGLYAVSRAMHRRAMGYNNTSSRFWMID